MPIRTAACGNTRRRGACQPRSAYSAAAAMRRQPIVLPFRCRTTPVLPRNHRHCRCALHARQKIRQMRRHVTFIFSAIRDIRSACRDERDAAMRVRARAAALISVQSARPQRRDIRRLMSPVPRWRAVMPAAATRVAFAMHVAAFAPLTRGRARYDAAMRSVAAESAALCSFGLLRRRTAVPPALRLPLLTRYASRELKRVERCC